MEYSKEDLMEAKKQIWGVGENMGTEKSKKIWEENAQFWDNAMGDESKEKQRNGGKLEAEEIYRETWLWLKARHCEKLVSPQLISQYAMAVSRWIQCEHAISEYDFLAKHPTTNAAIASPYVTMSQNYMKQVNQIWYQIYQVVKENCSVEFAGNTPQDDVMERLLRSRKV